MGLKHKIQRVGFGQHKADDLAAYGLCWIGEGRAGDFFFVGKKDAMGAGDVRRLESRVVMGQGVSHMHVTN